MNKARVAVVFLLCWLRDSGWGGGGRIGPFPGGGGMLLVFLLPFRELVLRKRIQGFFE